MGPYVYKTVIVNIGSFGAAERGASKIQNALDGHVAEGWELFEFQPVQRAFTRKWNVLIFRKPSP